MDRTRRRVPTAPTQPLPAPGSSRVPFYLSVGCGSLLLALVIGIGGYVGISALSGGSDDRPTASSAPTESADTESPDTATPSDTTDATDTPDSTETADATETASASSEPSEDAGNEDEAEPPASAVGKENAVARGTASPVSSELTSGYFDLELTELVEDATEAIAETNRYNDPPADGNRYLMAVFEGTYRGPGAERFSGWFEFTFVTADGTEYARTFVVTPQYGSASEDRADGESFPQEIVFEVPADLEAAGHVVVGPYGPSAERTWFAID